MSSVFGRSCSVKGLSSVTRDGGKRFLIGLIQMASHLVNWKNTAVASIAPSKRHPPFPFSSSFFLFLLRESLPNFVRHRQMVLSRLNKIWNVKQFNVVLHCVVLVYFSGYVSYNNRTDLNLYCRCAAIKFDARGQWKASGGDLSN